MNVDAKIERWFEFISEESELKENLFDSFEEGDELTDIGGCTFNRNVEGIFQTARERIIFENDTLKFIAIGHYLVEKHSVQRISEEFSSCLHDLTSDYVEYSLLRDSFPYMLIILEEEYDLDMLNICSNIDLEIDQRHLRLVLNDILKGLSILDKSSSAIEEILRKVQEINVSEEVYVNYKEFIPGFVESRPDDAFEVYLSFKDNPENGTHRLITGFLGRLASYLNFESIHEEAINLIEETNENLIVQGIRTLGGLTYHDGDKLDETLDVFGEIERFENEKITQELITAYGELTEDSIHAKEQIVNLSQKASKDYFPTISVTLLRIPDENKTEKWVKDVLNCLSTVNANDQETIQNIDFLLQEFVNDEPDFVFEFYERWLSHREYIFKQSPQLPEIFETSLTEVVRGDKPTLEVYLTRWFNSENTKLPRVAGHITDHFSVLGFDPPKLSEEVLSEFNELDLKFTVVKIAGHVHKKEILSEMIFSAVYFPEISDDLSEFLRHIFVDYIVYNYTGLIEEFLEEKIEEGEEIERDFAQEIKGSIENYLNDLRELPHLKEFEPSERRISAYQRAVQKRYSESMDRAEEESPILSMVSKMSLKGGRAFFERGERDEATNMIEHSTAMEMPRGGVADPVGMEQMRFSWRIISRDELDEISH